MLCSRAIARCMRLSIGRGFRMCTKNRLAGMTGRTGRSRCGARCDSSPKLRGEGQRRSALAPDACGAGGEFRALIGNVLEASGLVELFEAWVRVQAVVERGVDAEDGVDDQIGEGAAGDAAPFFDVGRVL